MYNYLIVRHLPPRNAAHTPGLSSVSPFGVVTPRLDIGLLVSNEMARKQTRRPSNVSADTNAPAPGAAREGLSRNKFTQRQQFVGDRDRAYHALPLILHRPTRNQTSLQWACYERNLQGHSFKSPCEMSQAWQISTMNHCSITTKRK